MSPKEHADIGESSDSFQSYIGMTSDEIARLVLCLLIEELLHERLASFRGVGASDNNLGAIAEIATSMHGGVVGHTVGTEVSPGAPRLG